MVLHETNSLAIIDEVRGEKRMKWRTSMSAMKFAPIVMFAMLGGLLATTADAQRGAARPQVERPEGEVWEIVRQNCTSCHGIDDYAFYALDGDGWSSLIDSSHTNLEQVSLSDDDQGLLLDWLVDEFGPESTPFPRTYIPPEITEFFTDPEAFRLMERACLSCHGMDRIDEGRNSLDAWRVILVSMRELGAGLTDEELETLSEWLSRTRGINPNQ
jgi:hypothetical protein